MQPHMLTRRSISEGIIRSEFIENSLGKKLVKIFKLKYNLNTFPGIKVEINTLKPIIVTRRGMRKIQAYGYSYRLNQ